MSGELLPHKILIVGEDNYKNEEVAALLQPNTAAIGIPLDLKFGSEKLSDSFEIIILIANNPAITPDSLLFPYSFHGIIDIPVIFISDVYSLEDISPDKIKFKKNKIVDFLPYSLVTSLLLQKSVLYAFKLNKKYLKHKALQKKYNDLFQMNPLPMWIYDLDQLKFWEVNEAAQRKYGYSKKEFLHMTLRDIRLDEDKVQLDKAIDNVRKHEKLFSNRIYRHKNKKGDIMYVELVSNIIYIKKVKYELVLANDITDSLNYIQTIENRNSKLQEIAFAHSHIIRAPLANMIGIMNLIRDMDRNSVQDSELLDHLSNSCNQLDERITEIVKKSTSYSSEK